MSTPQDRLDALLAKAEALARPAPAAAKPKQLPPGAMSPSARRRASEEEEDQELLKEAEEEGAGGAYLSVQPANINGQMRDYQLEALNWMIGLHDRGLSGILADEMGLGKTLESISLLGYLKLYRQNEGPHLILVPKTTTSNWCRELAKFCPSLSVRLFHGNKDERAAMRPLIGKDNVTVTTYEMALREKGCLSKVRWNYMFIDEAHRIKNDQSMLSKIVRTFHSKFRLLITGTPLQNNLGELWALLNFLLPSVFSSASDFQTWFSIGPSTAAPSRGRAAASSGDGEKKKKGEEDEEDDDDNNEEEEEDENEEDEERERSADRDDSEMKGDAPSTPVKGAAPAAAPQASLGVADDERMQIVAKLHRVLRPFLLRRLKADVEKSLLPKVETNLYIGLSEMQRQWYMRILKRDVDLVNSASKSVAHMRLLNMVMQLRKVCNHPYLFDGAEPGPPYVEGEHLVGNSGKMVLLDRLLRRLLERGSRVLIFSQMTRMLDVLEDYCRMRGFEYCRIDGSSKQEERDEQMDVYNAPGSTKFVFLLSTRAGGLGINLQTADTVVLYDSDWNPQMDLQAQDRAHRIGQTKQVHVYRFVTENTLEEKIVQRAYEKLFLDALVIQQGRLGATGANKLSSEEMQNMVRFGANQIFQARGATVTDEDIEAILARGAERTKVLNDHLKRDVNFDALTFKSDGGSSSSLYEFQGKDYRKEQSGGGGGGGGDGSGGGSGGGADAIFGDSLGFIDLGEREKKGGTYNINAYFKQALRVSEPKPTVREFRPVLRPDYQFFRNDRLEELERREWEARERFRTLLYDERERVRLVNLTRHQQDKDAKEAKRRAKAEATTSAAAAASSSAAAAAAGAADDDASSSDSEDADDLAAFAEDKEGDAPADDGEGDDDGEGEEDGEDKSGKGGNGDGAPGGDAAASSSEPASARSPRKGRSGSGAGGAAGAAGAAAAAVDESKLTPLELRRRQQARRRQELYEEAKFPSARDLREKERLLAEGFGTWTRRHVQQLVRAMETYGRDDTRAVFRSVEGKTPKEVEAYYKVFWKRVAELKEGERLVAQVERGEQRLARDRELTQLLRAKVRRYKDPFNALVVPYGPSNKVRTYSEEEDRFIICVLNEIGWGQWDELKRRIRNAWQFRFDWYLKSRATGELSRRADYLTKLLEKEAGGGASAPAAAGSKKRAPPKSSPTKPQTKKAAAATGKKKSGGSGGTGKGKKKPQKDEDEDDDDDNDNDNGNGNDEDEDGEGPGGDGDEEAEAKDEEEEEEGGGDAADDDGEPSSDVEMSNDAREEDQGNGAADKSGGGNRKRKSDASSSKGSAKKARRS